MKRRDFITSTLAGTALSAVGAGCKPWHNAEDNQCAAPECEPFGCHYARMFPRLARRSSTLDSTLEKGLAELGASMTERDSDANGMESAGYTYFGQFIDHDLTLDITPLDLAHPHVERIRNYRTPFLDLDHVYGGGPTVSPFLYEINGPPGKEKFIIGKTAAPEFSPDDLPRNENGIAIVVDPRSDENLIIAQLHVAFLKFHNFVMDELGSEEVKSAGPAGGTRFEQVRRFVTWHYQYAIVHDFLDVFLSEEVFKEVETKCGEQSIQKPRTFRLPVEFSAAVFRFGHSLVRDVYPVINDGRRHVGLPCLLALTGTGGEANIPCGDSSLKPPPFALPASWKVDWSNFFVMPQSGPQNPMRKIDTGVAKALHELRIEVVNKFSTAVVSESKALVSPKNILPVRTLWRGARMGLPSGQEVAKALDIKKALTEDEIKKSPYPEIEKLLLEYRFHQDTPLWYYVLKEAEIRGKRDKLGPVGSRIVADVLVEALNSDPNSYVSVDPKWKPTITGIPPGTISNILYFVKKRE
jgi:Animal haem peroxidase